MTEESQRKSDEAAGVELVCDGMNVPLNSFVQRFVQATVRGMVRSLEGVPDNPRTIELRIRKR
ncbi:MAG: hypothetical protein WAU81_11715 [Candidatus Aminicenantales bacterium]